MVIGISVWGINICDQIITPIRHSSVREILLIYLFICGNAPFQHTQESRSRHKVRGVSRTDNHRSGKEYL